MSEHSILEQIRQIAERIAEKNGYELVHTEKVGSGKRQIVRVFIDKPQGISHEDCAIFDRQFGDALEAEDIIPDSYLLEVSSPGLERELYSLKDFTKYAGKLAKIKLKKPVEGRKTLRGRISKNVGHEIFFEDKVCGQVRFAYENVAKANLEIDLEEELKRKS
jgi:ribosome maturation factor RimP